jgi:integrase
MHKQEMKILFHIGAMTGLRLIDACLLKWGNISFDDKLIRCIPHKTSRTAKQRQAVIPIPSTLNKVLRDALALRESPPDRNDFIMPNVASRYQYNSDGIGDDIKKVLEFTKLTTNEDPQEGIQRKKKICRYGFHSFRHYYASKMATEGYDINMLAKILADDIRTLQKYYINIDASAVREAFDTKEGQSNIKEQIVQALSDANEKQLQDIHNYVIKKITEKK